MSEVVTQVDQDDSLEKLSGRELDAVVAERVMGEPMPPAPTDCPHFLNTLSPQKAWHHVRDFDHGSGECKWEPEPFSTSIEAAMRVVERMRERGYQVSMRSWEGAVPWSVKFISYTSREEVEEDGDSLPSAICRAALVALEQKK